jgi:hypothetical protein
MITNYHLVLITYLQHTDVFMPHFDDKVSIHCLALPCIALPCMYMVAFIFMTLGQSSFTSFLCFPPHSLTHSLTSPTVCSTPPPGMDLAARSLVHSRPLLRPLPGPLLPPHLGHTRVSPCVL